MHWKSVQSLHTPGPCHIAWQRSRDQTRPARIRCAASRSHPTHAHTVPFVVACLPKCYVRLTRTRVLPTRRHQDEGTMQDDCSLAYPCRICELVFGMGRSDLFGLCRVRPRSELSSPTPVSVCPFSCGVPRIQTHTVEWYTAHTCSLVPSPTALTNIA